jgi:hypothetical protein
MLPAEGSMPLVKEMNLFAKDSAYNAQNICQGYSQPTAGKTKLPGCDFHLGTCFFISIFCIFATDFENTKIINKLI